MKLFTITADTVTYLTNKENDSDPGGHYRGCLKLGTKVLWLGPERYEQKYAQEDAERKLITHLEQLKIPKF